MGKKTPKERGCDHVKGGLQVRTLWRGHSVEKEREGGPKPNTSDLGSGREAERKEGFAGKGAPNVLLWGEPSNIASIGEAVEPSQDR